MAMTWYEVTPSPYLKAVLHLEGGAHDVWIVGLGGQRSVIRA